MALPDIDIVIAVVMSIFLFLALCASLVLVVISMRAPGTVPLVAAGALVVLCLVAVAVAPVNVPLLVGLMIALLATALAVIGGNPLTRRILDIASHGRVPEGANGGILLIAPRDDPSAEVEVLRGGTTIGYLERTAVVLSILVGFPEAIAIVVAVKSVGRFSELAASEARERFIIGTLASLLWAAVLGGLIRLAIW